MAAIIDFRCQVESEPVIDLDALLLEELDWQPEDRSIDASTTDQIDGAIESYLALDLAPDRARRWLLS